ncbi:MAG: hypothetical protein A3H28_00595 [Acidobacteria bacterium RIFCSPLOWO2_02_FULL_61_28]|nr:MAG: hypothetical protein A3H28_00595 [Acidobacteria bacterium RIFCSPLOWO2_02_FULL_61_28]
MQLAAVKTQPVRRTVEAVGSLFADEEVVVSSEVEGRTNEVLVDVGDRVTEGQVLVQISPTELQLASQQQQAALEQIRARLGLSESETTLRDIRDAAGVKKAAADLADVQQKFERAKELSEEGLLPRQGYEEAEARFKSAQANYDLALQEVRNLLAALKQVSVTSELAQKKLRDTQIRAPFGGYVKARSVAPGQFLRVQTPVFTLVRVDPLRARIAIPEKMAGWIPAGQAVTIFVEAYPDRPFTGKIARANPVVDPQTRSYEAEAVVQNREGLLRPGFFVKASIPTDRVENLLTIPQKALNYAYGVYSVYVVQGNQVQQREVKIGDRLANDVEIVAGLAAGDQAAIPVNQGQLLFNGASVDIAP